MAGLEARVTAVVGVDPGGRSTGIIAAVDGALLYRALVVRDGDDPFPDAAYCGEVIRSIARARKEAPGLVAVEAVKAPGGFKDGQRQPISLSGIIGTSIVLGAVLAAFPTAVVVKPGRNGKAGQLAYPPELWGPREGAAGEGRLRHCRSAWDVAMAAAGLQGRRAS